MQGKNTLRAETLRRRERKEKLCVSASLREIFNEIYILDFFPILFHNRYALCKMGESCALGVKQFNNEFAQSLGRQQELPLR